MIIIKINLNGVDNYKLLFILKLLEKLPHMAIFQFPRLITPRILSYKQYYDATKYKGIKM